MRYRAKIGSDFPVTEAVIKAQTAHLREQVRSIIVLTLLASVLAALVAAGIVSLVMQSPSILAYTWAAMATFVGVPLSYYFGRRASDEQDDDKGSVGTS